MGIKPEIAHEDWRLHIDGAVEQVVDLDWNAFGALPAMERVTDIHCVTAWSRLDNRWSGVGIGAILPLVRPTASARAVMLHGSDGYKTNLDLADFSHPDAMLVHSWDGEALGRDHGGPVRFVAPHLYFWKSAKWISRIEFLTEDEPGFWEAGGYHRRGDPWLEQRFRWSDPAN